LRKDRRGEAPGDLARDSQCLVERQGALLELLLEALPFVEGQGEERPTALGLAGLVDRRLGGAGGHAPNGLDDRGRQTLR